MNFRFHCFSDVNKYRAAVMQDSFNFFSIQNIAYDVMGCENIGSLFRYVTKGIYYALLRVAGVSVVNFHIEINTGD